MQCTRYEDGPTWGVDTLPNQRVPKRSFNVLKAYAPPISGKIMRRVLKKIANDERDLGDISTMADSSVVEVLH